MGRDSPRSGLSCAQCRTAEQVSAGSVVLASMQVKAHLGREPTSRGFAALFYFFAFRRQAAVVDEFFGFLATGPLNELARGHSWWITNAPRSDKTSVHCR
jgi:hypothetical protein